MGRGVSYVRYLVLPVEERGMQRGGEDASVMDKNTVVRRQIDGEIDREIDRARERGKGRERK